MSVTHRVLSISKIYIPLLLAFLVVNELSDNFILNIFAASSSTKKTEFILYGFYFLIQIVASPIQAGFSDRYCRRKSLIFALSFAVISIILVLIGKVWNFSFLVFFLIIPAKGGLGNILPLSLAAVADSRSKNVRFLMGLCTGAMAFGYLILLLFLMFFKPGTLGYILVGLLTVVLILCIKYFYDVRDKEGEVLAKSKGETRLQRIVKESKLIFAEPKLIVEELKQPRPRWAIYTFLFWEISQYSIHMLNVDLGLKQFSNLTTSMVCGYLLGLFILRMCAKLTDSTVIRIGYIVCILSVIPFFLVSWFVADKKIILLICYFFYNLGAVFLAPSLFSILAKEKQPHEQGKIFGLLESTDTVAFLICSVVTIGYSMLNLPDFVIVAFSFIIFIISWFLFSRFEKYAPSAKILGK